MSATCWTKTKALRYLKSHREKLNECMDRSIATASHGIPSNIEAGMETDPLLYSVMVASAMVLSETEKGACLENDCDLYDIAKELID